MKSKQPSTRVLWTAHHLDTWLGDFLPHILDSVRPAGLLITEVDSSRGVSYLDCCNWGIRCQDVAGYAWIPVVDIKETCADFDDFWTGFDEVWFLERPPTKEQLPERSWVPMWPISQEDIDRGLTPPETIPKSFAEDFFRLRALAFAARGVPALDCAFIERRLIPQIVLDRWPELVRERVCVVARRQRHPR